MAFNDATCNACGRRVSWMGELKDRPACKCGSRPAQSELDECEAEMEAARRRILGDDYDKDDDNEG